MAFSSSAQSVAASPNVTPLIDVLLVLLIIFMVITPTVPRGVDSRIPTGESSLDDSSQTPLIVEVLPASKTDGLVRYRLQGQDKRQQDLLLELQRIRSRSNQRTLWVGGDPRVDYRAVVELIASANTGPWWS